MLRKVLRLWVVLLFFVMVWFIWNVIDYFFRNFYLMVNIFEILFLVLFYGFLMKYVEIFWKVFVDLLGIVVYGEGIDRFLGSILMLLLMLNIYVYEMLVKFIIDLLWLFYNFLD